MLDPEDLEDVDTLERAALLFRLRGQKGESMLPGIVEQDRV